MVAYILLGLIMQSPPEENLSLIIIEVRRAKPRIRFEVINIKPFSKLFWKWPNEAFGFLIAYCIWPPNKLGLSTSSCQLNSNKESELKSNAGNLNEAFFCLFFMLTMSVTGPKASLNWALRFGMAFPLPLHGEREKPFLIRPLHPALLFLPWDSLEKLLGWKIFCLNFGGYHFQEFFKIVQGCWLPTRTQ